LSVAGTPEVAIPEGFCLDMLAADGAHELARVRVRGMGVFYPARSALLSQESADIGHVGGDLGWARRGTV
jgi:hypothetical protein